MKKNLTTLLFVFTFLSTVFSQVSIQERVGLSDIVVEGKIISKTSFWNAEKTKILTRNVVRVSKVFKGEIVQNEIGVITKGGEVGDDFQIVSHTFQVSIGNEGIFFLRKAKNLSKSDFWVRGIRSPFIKYVKQNSTFGAIDQKQKFFHPKRDLYDPIEAATNQSFKILGKNSLEISIEKWLDDNVALKTNSDILIEFSFDNITLSGNDFVEFDILAKTNEAGIKFAASDVYIQYSTAAFGENVVGNEKIEASKETIIEDNIYTLQLSDDSQDIVKFLVNSGIEPDQLYPLSSFFEKFIHVKLEIDNLWQLATLSFDDFLMANQSLFYDEENGEFIGFNKIAVFNPVFPFMAPIITEFSPNPVTAGTGTILSITGSQFGDQNADSKVKFRNADQFEDVELMEVRTGDILTWQDDLIEVIIPSSGGDGLTAGQGKIVVENSFGSDESDDILEILYSIASRRFLSPIDIEYRYELARQTEPFLEYGIFFNINKALDDEDNLAFDIVQDAVKQWRCETGISWNLSTEIIDVNTSAANDGTNLIYLADPSEFSNPDFLAETFITGSRRAQCGVGGTTQYVRDVDIAISNEDLTFFYALEGPVPLNRYDFYGIILHELGHAHMVDHALPATKMMYYQSQIGSPFRRELTTFDIQAGIDVIASSQSNLGNALCPVEGINESDCIGTTHVGEIKKNKILTVSPNPFRNKFLIDNSIDNLKLNNIQLIDVNGKTVRLKQRPLNSPTIEIIPQSDLPAGVYFLKIESEHNDFSFKLIKI